MTYKSDTMECANFKISATTEADRHLALIYQPPDINVLAFINDFAEIMEEQITRNAELIILGDFSMTINDKSDIGTINLLDFMESSDLTNILEIATQELQNTTNQIVVPKLSIIITDYNKDVSSQTTLWYFLTSKLLKALQDPKL